MQPARKIQVYDTTLRDGCQSEDVWLTLEDKLQIARRLDDLGIDYIEGGWPGSNERDAAFFREVKKLRLRHAKIAAFGATRRAGARARGSQPGAAAARGNAGGDGGRQDLGHARARSAAHLEPGQSRHPARHH